MVGWEVGTTIDEQTQLFLLSPLGHFSATICCAPRYPSLFQPSVLAVRRTMANATAMAATRSPSNSLLGSDPLSDAAG